MHQLGFFCAGFSLGCVISVLFFQGIKEHVSGEIFKLSLYLQHKPQPTVVNQPPKL